MGHTNFVELRAAGILKDKPALKLVASSPLVGQPATYVIGSDQYGGKIVSASRTGHTAVWQRVNDATGEPNPGFSVSLTRRRNGEYRAAGSHHGYIKLGVAKTSLDEGF
jgi:hypothetical protein